MVTIRPKTTVTMKLSAVGETHARSRVATRDLTSTIDEPVARDGTNQGFSPTETMVASLIGCTNVISKRIAHGMGLSFGEMKIEAAAEFDRRGVMLMEELDVPFTRITLDIEVATDATPEQLETVKADLARYCPIAKVLRGAGTEIVENWTTTPL